MEWLFHSLGTGTPRSDVGVEYRALLVGDDRKQKQIDIWFAASGEPKRWDYVELKVVFANGNKDKQFTSAGWDLWYLDRLDTKHEEAASTSVIVVGSGFHSDGEWASGLDRLREAAGPNAQADTLPDNGRFGGTTAVRWASWTRSFG